MGRRSQRAPVFTLPEKRCRRRLLSVMLHIPLLRKGEPYKSVDILRTQHYRTKEPFVGLSQANVGLIRRDLLDQEGPRRALAGYTTADLIRICLKAANHFVNDWLPLGEDAQSPQDYIE